MNFHDFAINFKCFKCAKPVNQQTDRCGCGGLMLMLSSAPEQHPHTHFHIELNKLYRIAIYHNHKADYFKTCFVEFKDRAKPGNTLFILYKFPEILINGNYHDVLNYFESFLIWR